MSICKLSGHDFLKSYGVEYTDRKCFAATFGPDLYVREYIELMGCITCGEVQKRIWQDCLSETETRRKPERGGK